MTVPGTSSELSTAAHDRGLKTDYNGMLANAAPPEQTEPQISESGYAQKPQATAL